MSRPDIIGSRCGIRTDRAFEPPRRARVPRPGSCVAAGLIPLGGDRGFNGAIRGPRGQRDLAVRPNKTLRRAAGHYRQPERAQVDHQRRTESIRPTDAIGDMPAFQTVYDAPTLFPRPSRLRALHPPCVTGLDAWSHLVTSPRGNGGRSEPPDDVDWVKPARPEPAASEPVSVAAPPAARPS